MEIVGGGEGEMRRLKEREKKSRVLDVCELSRLFVSTFSFFPDLSVCIIGERKLHQCMLTLYNCRPAIVNAECIIT